MAVWAIAVLSAAVVFIYAMQAITSIPPGTRHRVCLHGAMFGLFVTTVERGHDSRGEFRVFRSTSS